MDPRKPNLDEFIDAKPVNHVGQFVIHACPYTAKTTTLIMDNMATCMSHVAKDELIVESSAGTVRLRPVTGPAFHLGINVLLYHTCDPRSLAFWEQVAKIKNAGLKDIDTFGAKHGLSSSRPLAGFQSPTHRGRSNPYANTSNRNDASSNDDKPVEMPFLMLGIHNVPEALQSFSWPKFASSSMRKDFETEYGTKPCAVGERRVPMKSVLKLCQAFNAPWVEMEHGQLYSVRVVLEEITRLVILSSIRPAMQLFAEVPAITPLNLSGHAHPSGIMFTNDHLIFTDTANQQLSKVFMGDKYRMLRPIVSGETAKLGHPTAVCIHGDGSILICDSKEHVIHRLGSPAAWWDDRVNASIFAGTSSAGFKDGPYLQASFDEPGFLSRATNEDVYLVADTGNNAIRLLKDGHVSTISTGHINSPLSARFSDTYGTIVADTGNHVIRYLQHGVTHILAGSGDLRYADGPAARARFCRPSDAIEASHGAIFICDAGNSRVRMLLDGNVTTISYSEHVRLISPMHFALSPDGELFLSDSLGSRIVHMIVPDIENLRSRGNSDLALVHNIDVQVMSRTSFLVDLILQFCVSGALPKRTKAYLINSLRSEKHFPNVAEVFKSVRRMLLVDLKKPVGEPVIIYAPKGDSGRTTMRYATATIQAGTHHVAHEAPADESVEPSPPTLASSPTSSTSWISATSSMSFAASHKLYDPSSEKSSPILSARTIGTNPDLDYESLSSSTSSLGLGHASTASSLSTATTKGSALSSSSLPSISPSSSPPDISPLSMLVTPRSSTPPVTGTAPPLSPPSKWEGRSTFRESSLWTHRPTTSTSTLHPWTSPITPTLRALLTHDDKGLLLPSFNWTAHESSRNQPEFVTLNLKNICAAPVTWSVEDTCLVHTTGPDNAFIFNISPKSGRIEPGQTGTVQMLINIGMLHELWNLIVIRATTEPVMLNTPLFPVPLTAPCLISFIPILGWSCAENIPTTPKAFTQVLESRDKVVILSMFGESIELAPKGTVARQESNVRAAPLPTLYWTIDQDILNGEELVGMGSSAAVYRADIHGLTVAVKKWDIGIKDATPEDFLVELQAFTQFRHPKLLRFYGAKQAPGVAYLVTEFAGRGTMYDWLLKSPIAERTWGRKLQMALDVAEGLAYLHSLSWIHRDVKGLNILLLDNLGARLADFGSSSAVHNSQPRGVGSFHWMAPEVSLTTSYSIQSDVFSFGMMLLELLIEAPPIRTGEQIREGAVAPEHLAPHRASRPEFISLIEACCKPNPSERLSMIEVIQQLKDQMLLALLLDPNPATSPVNPRLAALVKENPSGPKVRPRSTRIATRPFNF